MPKQMLATMVYADCLDYLSKQDAFATQYEDKRNQALCHIEQTLARWPNEDRTKSELLRSMSASDLSYSVDLLFRTNRLSREGSQVSDIVSVLTATVDSIDTVRPIASDTLYCAIQLATHFSEFAEAKRAVRTLIGRLRTKYEKLDLKKETAFFHPL